VIILSLFREYDKDHNLYSEIMLEIWISTILDYANKKPRPIKLGNKSTEICTK